MLGLAARDDLIRKWSGYLFPPNEPAPAQQLRPGHPEAPVQKGVPAMCFHGFAPTRPETWTPTCFPLHPGLSLTPYPDSESDGKPGDSPDRLASAGHKWGSLKLLASQKARKPWGGKGPSWFQGDRRRPSVLFTVMKPSPTQKLFEGVLNFGRLWTKRSTRYRQQQNKLTLSRLLRKFHLFEETLVGLCCWCFSKVLVY